MAKEPGRRPASARAIHEELMRLLEREGGTEGWTAPYAFPTGRGEDGAPVEEVRPRSEPPREPPAEEPLPPPPGQEARAASETAGSGEGERGAARRHEGWRRALAGLVLVLYPERGRVPTPLCAALISWRDLTKFGELTHEASPIRGARIDPSMVVYRGRDAAVMSAAYVTVYVQAPGRRFPD